MNRGTIRTLVKNFVADPNGSRFSPTQYNDAINLACQQFCFDTRALYKDAPTYTTVAGTSGYDLPTDFWLEKVVTHKGLELTPISRATLLKDNGDDWTDDEGTPRYYIIDPEEARKKLTLYPIPEAADAGANLILTYYPIPADIASDSDSPFNSSAMMTQFHQGIAAYAASLLLLYETMTQEILVKRNELQKMYLEQVSFAIDRFGNTIRELIQLRPSRRYRNHP